MIIIVLNLEDAVSGRKDWTLGPYLNDGESV